MKSNIWRWLYLLIVISMMISGCSKPTAVVSPTTSPTQSPGDEPIYLSIIWHQHQPVYYKDPDTGVYEKPWVRVHAAKDYVDMASMLKDYPNIHATFNLTPSLIRQLDDLKSGAKDLYWVTAEIPAEQLSDPQKQFLLDRFFDTNRKIIGRYPRYMELLQKRDAGQDFSVQDFLDLQVLFNLAWTDPDWLSQAPLASLIEKGANYSEEDKATVFAEHLRLIGEVIPVHKELQEAGQIEVTMTPYAHPILPLLVSTKLALIANPSLDLPSKAFAYGQDAIDQVNLGVELYKDHFGVAPRGMWPAEGSVAQEIVNMVSSTGIQWMASDEGVLAASLGKDSFIRDSKEVVTDPDTLYRPYYVQSSQGNPVAIVFRDVVISDKVGFTYSGVSGTAAAKDFINRVHAIRDALIAAGAIGPHLVSVILDGENAWENYDNDGKEFLNSLYRGLSEDPLIKTVTPSEFLEMAPDQPKIQDLWAGSWINHDFTTWIGEEEENRGWDYLATTRELLQKYVSGVRQTTPEILQEAQNYMYIAEGSDWFWWFGSDQSSGNDETFDQQFRSTLKQVYETLGEQPPTFLDVPIIPLNPISADIASSDLISPTIDGQVLNSEWDSAGVYIAAGGVMGASEPYFDNLAYGFSAKELFIKIESKPGYSSTNARESIELYLQTPSGDPTNDFSRNDSLLGFPANRMIEILLTDGEITAATLYISEGSETWGSPVTIDKIAKNGDVIELSIQLTSLGNADTGDRISLRSVHTAQIDMAGVLTTLDTELLPGNGPAILVVPDLGTMTLVLDVNDPERDDYGPGTYTYPSDAVFQAGSYDILNFQVGSDTENIVFKFTMRGPVENSWGSPNGLSVQTFDIYIDRDGDANGSANFLPGRNLALADGFRWDYAITIEGWEPGIYIPGDAGPEKVATSSEFQVLADPGQQRVTIRIPKTILGDNPDAWKYSAVVLSQEGYPSGGVMRVRDVNQNAEQWRIGGGPADTNHTRVMDLVWPDAGEQESWLSTYSPSQKQQTELNEADFARVEMLIKGQ